MAIVMAAQEQIVTFLDQELRISEFDDASLNGLQVEGGGEVNKLAVAVDAGLSVIEAAAAEKAQMLMVHHGLFWGDALAVTGPRKKALKTLFDAEINLYAAHLPLDAHEQHGNNFCLARMLGLESLEPAVVYRGAHIGCRGSNAGAKSLKEMVEVLKTLPGANHDFTTLAFGPEKPENVCLLSGSGVDQIYSFEKENFDTLVTGEPKQFAYHFAKENKLNVICAGHYATETIGVRTLGEALAEKFKLELSFIDEPTGI